MSDEWTPLSPTRSFESVPGVPNLFFSPAPIRDPQSPANSSVKEPENHPTNIIIVGWMDASPQFIIKYCRTYDKMFPAANQFVMLAVPSDMHTVSSRLHAKLKHVVNVFKECGIIGASGPSRTILHTFSGGGCFKLVALVETIARYAPPPPGKAALPAQCIIFDSCPGQPNINGAHLALQTALFKPSSTISDRLSTLLLSGILYSQVICGFFPTKNMFTQMNAQLLDPKLLPHEASRSFIYSKTDNLVYWEDARSHIERARQRGIKVFEEVLHDDSPHVAHMKQDPLAYWGTVKRTWESTKL